MADPKQKLPYTLAKLIEILGRAAPGGAIDKSLSEKVSKSGGKMTGLLEISHTSYNNQLRLERAGGGGDVIASFYINGVQKGCIGFDNSGKLFMRQGTDSASTTSKMLFGEHNKPSGTYTGNGSATARAINTGGIGNVVVLLCGTYITFVTPKGGFCAEVSGRSMTYFTGQELRFENGVLTIATASGAVNYNNSIITYHVL